MRLNRFLAAAGLGSRSGVGDEFERKTIFDLFPVNWPRAHHVGRIDNQSEGLIFMTNEGDLTHLLTYPSHEVEKDYDVLLNKAFDPADREKLLRGFRIELGYAKCEGVEILNPGRIRLGLKQGLKRQLRPMLYKLGYEVERLVRIRMGPIFLEGLARGKWRFLTQKEAWALRNPKPATRTVAPKRPPQSPRVYRTAAWSAFAQHSRPNPVTPRSPSPFWPLRVWRERDQFANATQLEGRHYAAIRSCCQKE